MRIAAAMVMATLFISSAAHAFDLQGHRGARGLAPENTIPAFETALTIGVSTLELDLAVTRDGVLVVSHDTKLNPDHTRGPDGKFLEEPGPAIRSLSFEELQRFDVGRIRPDTAYAALPWPAHIPHFNDYEHLERVAEWSTAGGDDE